MPYGAFVIASVNALLNSASAVLIAGARRRARRRDAAGHRRLMLAATSLQGLFLVLYLAKWSVFGTTPFEGTGPVRVAYLALLGTHMAAAAFSAPLVVWALVLGLRARWARHRAVVRWAFPLWLFASVTGPLTYAMLYGLGRPPG